MLSTEFRSESKLFMSKSCKNGKYVSGSTMTYKTTTAVQLIHQKVRLKAPLSEFLALKNASKKRRVKSFSFPTPPLNSLLWFASPLWLNCRF